jgi:hypothetical protein
MNSVPALLSTFLLHSIPARSDPFTNQ